jgi:hypothetical protein
MCCWPRWAATSEYQESDAAPLAIVVAVFRKQASPRAPSKSEPVFGNKSRTSRIAHFGFHAQMNCISAYGNIHRAIREPHGRSS